MFYRLSLGLGLAFLSLSASVSAAIPTLQCRSTPDGRDGRFEEKEGFRFEEGIDNYLVWVSQRAMPESFMEKLIQKPADYRLYRLSFEFEKVRNLFGRLEPACFFTPLNPALINCLQVTQLVGRLSEVDEPRRRPIPIGPGPTAPSPPPELLDRVIDLNIALKTQKISRELLQQDRVIKDTLLRLEIAMSSSELPEGELLRGEISFPYSACTVGDPPEALPN